MRKRITLSILLLMTGILTFARPDSLHIYSMEEIYRQNSWLDGENPIGLSFNSFHAFSIAKAGYSHQKGNLGNTAFPSSADNYSIYSESFQQLGKASVYGKMGYRNSQKHRINWNGMTGDYWQSLNLCDSVSGKQSAEQYQLAGTFSLPVSAHWMVGSRLDYLVELTAKDTDPRNKNQWMEWEFTPGIGYQNKAIRWGASFLYSSKKEKVDYQNIGAHSTYPFFISYPLGFFKTLPGNENVDWHYSAEELGGALQLENKFGALHLYQEISGRMGEQDIVSRQIQNKKEGETDLWRIKYNARLTRHSATHFHEWNVRIVYNNSESYDPLQQQDVNGIWHTYGKVLRSASKQNEYALEYGYYRLRNDQHPQFSLVSGVLYNTSKQTIFFYPIKYVQPAHHFTLHSILTHSLRLKSGEMNCRIGLKYGKGSGDIMKKEQSQTGQSMPDIKLWKNPERLEENFNILTEPRWSARASILYTHTSDLQWFIGIEGEYEKANGNPSYENKKYFSLQFGLLF